MKNNLGYCSYRKDRPVSPQKTIAADVPPLSPFPLIRLFRAIEAVENMWAAGGDRSLIGPKADLGGQ